MKYTFAVYTQHDEAGIEKEVNIRADARLKTVVRKAAEDIKFGNLADGKVYSCKVEILNGFNVPVGIVEVLGKVANRVRHAQIMRDGSIIWHDSRFVREDMGVKEFRI